MGRQKLSTKILIATMISFVLVYLAVITVTPYFVYHLVRESEAKEALAFNEQVGMRIEQRFDELTRFSSVVAMDETLNREIADCMKSPSPGAEAALRLRISGMIQKDGVSSYHVLGIYIETENEDGSIFRTETVGFPENVKRYLQNTLIPSYLEAGKETAYILPFGYSDEDTQSYFGSGFTQVYGFIRPYGKDGRIAIISSYDEISLIAGALEDNYTDFLLCAGGRPIPPVSETGRINPDELEGRMAIGSSYQESSLITKDGIYAARDLGSSGWSMITWLDRAEVLRRNRNQTWMIFLTVGIFSLILGGVIFIIVTRFTRPLMEVSERMRQIAGGDFSARVEVHSEDEIGQVSRAFNAMARQLEEKIEAIVEKEKQEQSMKYSLLISQVDPHFLYNTMNMITYLAQKGRNEDIVVVNRAMIEILKDRLRIEISQVYDTVEQEISVIRQYLIIQEYRYEGMFRVRYDIDENVLKKARLAAKEAGVEGMIHFQRRDVKDLSHPQKYGFLITNPPYGERLEDKEKLPAIYSSLGNAFNRLDSWSAYVITPYEGIEKDFGRKATKKRKLYNGMIKTDLYAFEGPRPPKKQRNEQ